ncbi:pyridoxamine 5'-phosphate oxidase [Arthrobacter glacialis]|uniref:Pyridoxamine 5'-phosphate oxidase n=2 Tax=Arthrobacter glacialis TaxID=1664 RepID=A0A2S3ZT82_ARTGL|nr:pyridoxamine 5'-phosphate oxidase [Arthrobacter glacialis]
MSAAWWWPRLPQPSNDAANPAFDHTSMSLDLNTESIHNRRIRHMSQNENIHKVMEIVEHHRICMLTTVGDDGAIMGWPMTVTKVEDNGELWFFSSTGTGPVAAIGTEARVNLSFGGKNEWLSVHGSAVVITSEPKARELWNEAAAAFYPNGPESKDLVLVRVRPDGAQYWEAPGGAISTIFQWAKARLTGEVIDAGESQKVEL